MLRGLRHYYDLLFRKAPSLSFNPLTPASDGHLISPFITTLGSIITVVRIKEMITNSRNFLLLDKLSFFKVKLLLNDSKLSLKTKLQRIRCKFISLFYNKFRGNSNLVSGSNSTTRTALIYLLTNLVAYIFLTNTQFQHSVYGQNSWIAQTNILNILF